LLNVPLLANWSKIEEYRKTKEQEYNQRKQWWLDRDYYSGNKVLATKDGILCKSESWYDSEPWTITSVHTNGTIRIESRTKSERLNIRRVTPSIE
jgi:hypothetical protein